MMGVQTRFESINGSRPLEADQDLPAWQSSPIIYDLTHQGKPTQQRRNGGKQRSFQNKK